ncbi:hypothetical protein AAFN88_03970 [Pelagibius sp. CAU 1746]|uniref:hypothetical protein n=1 Tax=Pelagibius sp. CAU 1746 TaxID=3140370 RepID=UPI00325A6BC6
MVFLVMTLLLILFLAFAVDFLLTEEEVSKWRKATKELRGRFRELDVFAATEASNQWFLGLFKAIYGARFFSRRRLVASFLSTLLAMVLVAYVLQIFAEPGFHILLRGMASGMVVLTVINLIADFLSLQETFWIMRWSQGRGFLGILFLSLLDLLLTTLIYALTVGVIFSFAESHGDIFEPLLDLLGEPDFTPVDDLMGIGGFLVILGVSTYVTSFLWICFVGSAFLLRILQLASPALQRLISIIGASERPAFAVAGFLCALVSMTYGASQAVLWASDRLL